MLGSQPTAQDGMAHLGAFLFLGAPQPLTRELTSAFQTARPLSGHLDRAPQPVAVPCADATALDVRPAPRRAPAAPRRPLPQAGWLRRLRRRVGPRSQPRCARLGRGLPARGLRRGAQLGPVSRAPP